MTKSSLPKRTVKLIARDAAAVRGYSTITRVVLGLGDHPSVIELRQLLQARGLTVETAANAEAARKLAVGSKITAVVIPVAEQACGGLLATAKIVTALPTAKIVLVSPLPDERVEQFAEFIDAAVVFESDGLAAIVNAI
ncbi:hypothetical protein BH11PLA2_BH11PLA2_28560 [soil metagenome]